MNPRITDYYNTNNVLWEELHRGIKIEVCLYILMQSRLSHEAWKWSWRESWTKALVLLHSYAPLHWGDPRKKTLVPLRALCSLLSAVHPASGRSLTHWCRRRWPLGLKQEGRVWGRGGGGYDLLKQYVKHFLSLLINHWTKISPEMNIFICWAEPASYLL